MNWHHLSKSDTIATASSVESLLLTPSEEAVTHTISTAGEAISHRGKFLLRSSPLKFSQKQARRTPRARFAEAQAEKREEQSSTQRLAVDIQPRYDGTGIELIANNDHGNTGEYRENRPSASLIQGSLLMIDPASTEAENKETLPMNLKILQGKGLPFKNTRIRIGVLNHEGGAVDQIVGTTPSSEGSRDPIWGSRNCSWTLNASHSTKLLFTLIPENSAERKKKNLRTTLCASASAADLLLKRNPNVWIVLNDPENPNSAKNYGRIQIRLTRPTEAKIHEQLNCQRITSGPAIPRMQSYAIRKMALYSCSPVILNVYDVTHNPRMQTFNNTTKSLGYGGAFHTGIEIHGKEYSFGGTVNKESKFSGVIQCAPKKCPMHHYRESVFLGDCELNSQQIQSILTELRPKWIAKDYNLFRRNCACFSREFAIELGVGDLPKWVFSLTTTAESIGIEPYLHKINSFLKNRAKATSTKAPRKRITKLISSKDASASKEVRIDSQQDIEAHEFAKNTQEALLDHAMATRIQRAFRATRANARRAKMLELQVATVASA